jgi:hypothetical protein
MNTSPRPIALLLGVLFFLGVPLCFLATRVYSVAQPRLYSAATGFKLLLPEIDGPRLPDAFQTARQQYPSRMQGPLTAQTELKQSGAPDQYFIVAIDAHPLTAANAANMLTVLVRDSLYEKSKEDRQRVEIVQKAEIPKAPSVPNVQQIKTVGFAAAVLCGAAGVVSFIIAFAGRISGNRTA